jgi:hypothetical protein
MGTNSSFSGLPTREEDFIAQSGQWNCLEIRMQVPTSVSIDVPLPVVGECCAGLCTDITAEMLLPDLPPTAAFSTSSSVGLILYYLGTPVVRGVDFKNPLIQFHEVAYFSDAA